MLVRGELRGIHQNCLRRVKEFAEKYNIGRYLQDDYMTLSSDRYVLPLKANFKGRIQGIIHDYSNTGETLYFEPMFLVEQNNRLQELKQQEREEERKVMRMIADLLVQEMPQVEAAWKLLVEIDLGQAKCALGAALNGRCVPLEEDALLNLPGARHPLLVLEAVRHAADKYHAGPRRIEPADLTLREGDRVLVISGGNAGGKTVALKTLGLITLMTLAGLPVPVDGGAALPYWNQRPCLHRRRAESRRSCVHLHRSDSSSRLHLGKPRRPFPGAARRIRFRHRSPRRAQPLRRPCSTACSKRAPTP